MIDDLTKTLIESYYTHIDLIIESAIKENKLRDFDKDIKIFLFHFDNVLGPALATSGIEGSGDDTIAKKLRELKISKIVPTRKQDSIFYNDDKVDPNLRKRIEDSFDLIKQRKRTEIILKLENKFVFLRSFNCENSWQERGNEDRFGISILTSNLDIEKEKLLENIKKYFMIKLQKYFNLFSMIKKSKNKKVYEKYVNNESLIKYILSSYSIEEEDKKSESVYYLKNKALIKHLDKKLIKKFPNYSFFKLSNEEKEFLIKEYYFNY